MKEFEIKFFALIPIDANLDYYQEISDTDLPKYLARVKKGSVKHIQVCCYKNIGLFENELVCSRILN